MRIQNVLLEQPTLPWALYSSSHFHRVTTFCCWRPLRRERESPDRRPPAHKIDGRDVILMRHRALHTLTACCAAAEASATNILSTANTDNVTRVLMISYQRSCYGPPPRGRRDRHTWVSPPTHLKPLQLEHVVVDSQSLSTAVA